MNMFCKGLFALCAVIMLLSLTAFGHAAPMSDETGERLDVAVQTAGLSDEAMAVGIVLPTNAINLSWLTKSQEPRVIVNNETAKQVNSKETVWVKKGSATTQPRVLVIHTHGSESYADEQSNNEANVITVGKYFCDQLRSYGINVIHDTQLHDTVFNESYKRSAESVQELLKTYPTIEFVIDIHRDAVEDSTGNQLKTFTIVNGTGVAQVMIVVGTDEGGANHPNWRENFALAVELQTVMNNKYPTLARPINLRKASFNQGLSTGALLLEIGSYGNTLEEAKLASIYAAECFAQLLLPSDE